MLQLFDPGIYAFFPGFCRAAVVALPVIREPGFPLGVLVQCVAESADPAFTKYFRINAALLEDTPCGHPGGMLLVEIPFELLRKTDGAWRNLFNIMVRAQVIHLFLGKWVLVGFIHCDPILSVTLYRIQLTTKTATVVSTKWGFAPKILSAGRGPLKYRCPFYWVQFKWNIIRSISDFDI